MLAGSQVSGQALADLAQSLPHTEAQAPVSAGSPSSKQAPERKRTVSAKGGTAYSPGSHRQARNDVEQRPRKRQTIAVPKASGREKAAREAGRLG